jgi:hypothetical protein
MATITTKNTHALGTVKHHRPYTTACQKVMCTLNQPQVSAQSQKEK